MDPNEPQAKSLGYVEDAAKVDPKANPNFKPGQHCANCLQVPTGKENGDWIPCNIFAGRQVVGQGLVQGLREAPVSASSVQPEDGATG